MGPQTSLLTDAQFAALLSALVALGGGLIAMARWAVGRVVKAIDDSTGERTKQIVALTELRAKIDEVHEVVAPRSTFRERFKTSPVGQPLWPVADEK